MLPFLNWSKMNLAIKWSASVVFLPGQPLKLVFGSRLCFLAWKERASATQPESGFARVSMRVISLYTLVMV